tara:strand:- start:964 stop:1197 length:234 start_codon:yes stop_codon:yes gene_type:complete
MSSTQRLINHLVKGNAVTAKEITGKFGLANPSAAIRAIRLKGYAVYNNPVTLWNGVSSSKYRIGTPSRAMIAAAFSA